MRTAAPPPPPPPEGGIAAGGGGRCGIGTVLCRDGDCFVAHREGGGRCRAVVQRDITAVHDPAGEGLALGRAVIGHDGDDIAKSSAVDGLFRVIDVSEAIRHGDGVSGGGSGGRDDFERVAGAGFFVGDGNSRDAVCVRLDRDGAAVNIFGVGVLGRIFCVGDAVAAQMQAVVVEVGVESGGAGGVQRPAVHGQLSFTSFLVMSRLTSVGASAVTSTVRSASL